VSCEQRGVRGVRVRPSNNNIIIRAKRLFAPCGNGHRIAWYYTHIIMCIWCTSRLGYVTKIIQKKNKIPCPFDLNLLPVRTTLGQRPWNEKWHSEDLLYTAGIRHYGILYTRTAPPVFCNAIICFYVFTKIKSRNPVLCTAPEEICQYLYYSSMPRSGM